MAKAAGRCTRFGYEGVNSVAYFVELHDLKEALVEVSTRV